MASHVPTLPDLSGARDLLALLADREAAAAMLVKMEKLADEINLSLTIRGTVEEIEELRRRADSEFARAKQFGAETMATIEQAHAKLAADKKAFLQHMDTREAALRDERTALLEQVRLERDAITAREHAAKAAQSEFDEHRQRVADKEAWAEQMISEYRGKLHGLREYLKGV